MIPGLISIGAEAVAIFGSVARGDADASSDADVLVVYDEAPSRDQLRELRSRTDEKVGLSIASWSKFDAPRGQWRFYRSLESDLVCLHGPEDRLRSALREVPSPGTEELEKHCRALARKLEPYEPDTGVAWCGGYYLNLYADCYRWADVAMRDANAAAETFGTRREEVRAEFTQRHPELAEQVGWLATIEPIYLKSKGKNGRAELPFSDTDTHDEALLSLQVAQEVIDVAVAEMTAPHEAKDPVAV